MSGLLIKNATIIPLDGRRGEEAWFKGDIAVEDTLIKEIGENLQEKYGDYEVIAADGNLVLPGFINCHTHAAMILLRGYADDMQLQEWLSQKIWPREEHLKANDIYWGSLLAVLEMIKSGTTAFADMYFMMEKTAEAVSQAGIRAVLARGMMGFGQKALETMKESEELIKNWHGQAEGRITCMLGPHAPYTCPPDYLKEVIKLADKHNVGIHIHLAETAGEVNDMKEKYGLSPIKLMDSIGLFTGRRVVAAHCVHLGEEEMEILIENKVGIAHNPESNMKLASGVASVPELLQKGALVSLGTDGASSNNNLDMIGEMRSCALLHKVFSQEPTVVPAQQVLEMATVDGAKALGLDRVGSLQPGYKADMIIVDVNEPHMIPLYNPVANLVYAAHASDVKTMIVNGKVIMKDRIVKTLDEEKIKYMAKKCGEDLMRR